MLYFFGSKSHSDPFKQIDVENPIIAHLGGFLLIDSGNEDPTYLFRCQERYLPYAGLCGIRCLLFTRHAEHQQEYIQRYTILQELLDKITHYTKIRFPQIPQPILIECDTNTYTLGKVMINDSSILDSVKKGIYCNQISPLGVSLLRQFLTQIPDHQTDIYAYEQAGRLALRFNNKKAYVHLLQWAKNPHALPNHVPTAFISFNEIQKITWHDLHRIFTHQIGSDHISELYVKSSLDCGGEGSALISEKNFDEKIATLKQELCDKQKHCGRKNSNLDLLVQSRVQSNEDGKYPTNIGFVYYIHDMNMIKRIDIHGQIYADPERIEYLGSYLSKDFEAKILSLVDERKILNLCQLFAQEGYRGPINFDAVRNTHNEIAFIFDCNPRMSAAFPNIALSIFLQTLPLPVCSLANIGYRGRMIFENISEKLHELDRANLLFTNERKKGVFILPSFARNNGYDVWMINMSLNEMKTFIEDGYLTSLSNKKECDYTGFYF